MRAHYMQFKPKMPQEIKEYLRSINDPKALMAPNFFAELKDPRGTNNTALLQAGYNGAVDARGLHQLQKYNNIETISNNAAFTIAST